MADTPVIFMQLTQYQYNGITPKDDGTLYFCTDTQNIYLGSKLYGGSDIAKLTIKNGTNTVEYDGSTDKSIEIPTVTVDTALSSTSTNPVQNKAVKSAIDENGVTLIKFMRQDNVFCETSVESILDMLSSGKKVEGELNGHRGKLIAYDSNSVTFQFVNIMPAVYLANIIGTLPQNRSDPDAWTTKPVVNYGFENSSPEVSVTTYPRTPGVYRTIGTEIFSNLSFSHNNYGVLVIFRGNYVLHMYHDAQGSCFLGYSGETVAEPQTWRRIPLVYERGSDDNWIWIKYSDGYAELWGKKSFSGSVNSAWGNLYALKVDSPDYPFTFVSYPYVTRDVLLDGSNSCMLASWNASSLNNCGAVGIVRPNINTVSGSVVYHVYGKWV